MLRKLNYYLIAENNDWGKVDFIRRASVDMVHKLLDLRFVYYSNKNLPRKQAFRIKHYNSCIVFEFRMFDVSFWWGDAYQDMDLQG